LFLLQPGKGADRLDKYLRRYCDERPDLDFNILMNSTRIKVKEEQKETSAKERTVLDNMRMKRGAGGSRCQAGRREGLCGAGQITLDGTRVEGGWCRGIRLRLQEGMGGSAGAKGGT
jgi:hypothetical protein